MNKQLLIETLQLGAAMEGGYFFRTYQSDSQVHARALMSSIYYLLTDEQSISYFHLNQSDIMHYFHLGSPITYMTISPSGQLDSFILGPDITQGQLLQRVVKGGYWKASILKAGEFGLLSEAVAPGFEYTDMIMGEPETLQSQFPGLWEKISLYVKSKEII